jgi:DNA processing protein
MDHRTAGDSANLTAWLRLRLTPGIGSVRFLRLVQALGSPEAVLKAPWEQLAAIKGIGQDLARSIANGELTGDPRIELERLEQLGSRVITLEHEEYPPLLKSVFAPPPMLFVMGDLAPSMQGGVAIVGSRAFSPYGRRVAQEVARDLALAGKSVISGLARGIDTAAHQAALEAGGHTVGVLGCGLDRAYPPENRDLIREMAHKGAVISEFPLGTPPAAGNFPVRNRVISGLSQAVVIVEAGRKSGSLITARHALDQGREVFAVPGPVGSPQSEGCHDLIRQGARLLSSAADLLEPGALMPSPVPAMGKKTGGIGSATPPAIELPPEWRQVLDVTSVDPVHVDLIVRESGLKPQEVTAILVSLEMEGLVEQQPGKHYVRL